MLRTRNQPEGPEGKKRKKRTLQTTGSTGLPEGFEHDESLSVPVGSSAAASLRPTARRARGRGRGRGNTQKKQQTGAESSNLQPAAAAVAGVKRIKCKKRVRLLTLNQILILIQHTIHPLALVMFPVPDWVLKMWRLWSL